MEGVEERKVIIDGGCKRERLSLMEGVEERKVIIDGGCRREKGYH